MDVEVEIEPRVRDTPLAGRGGSVRVLDFGAPERPVDVVFSHANGFNARTYRTILAPLSAGLRVLAFDMRGHGGTELPAEVAGREGWTLFRDDLIAFLAAEVPGPVVLAGHSMGATVSLLAAAAAPDRVKALALFDPVIFDAAMLTPSVQGDGPLVAGALRRRAVFPSRTAAVEAYRGRGAFRTWSEDQFTDYVAAGFRDRPDGQVVLACAPEWEASSYRLHAYDPWAAFAQARCPVRILKAESGSTAWLDERLEEIEAAGRVTVETVPGTTHFLPMERPDLVQAELRAATG